MRILFSSILVVVHLFCLSLPVVALERDVGSQVNQEPEADSDNTAGVSSSWGSFLSPSYLMESIQSLVPPDPSPSDWWDKAKEYEQSLQDYVPRLLESAGNYFKSTEFTDVTSAMKDIVHTTATFRDNIKDTLDAQNISLDTLTNELESIFSTIVHDLKNIPTPDKAPGHAERNAMVKNILDGTESALIDLAIHYGIDVEVVETYLHTLRPQVQMLVVAVGDINEQHPQLLPALAFSVAALLIPESWILRPLLSMFGFGLTGVAKGSVAAWLQRYFWGAEVARGSWFSLLQAAGMGNIPKWVGPVVKLPLAIVGSLLGMILPCSNCTKQA